MNKEGYLMEQINYLYAQYEKSRPCASLFSSAKYGFEWSVDDGVIFYPSGYLSRSRAALLRCAIPSVPVCICGEEREREREKKTSLYQNCRLKASKMPSLNCRGLFLFLPVIPNGWPGLFPIWPIECRLTCLADASPTVS